jgi:hypothetical protein
VILVFKTRKSVDGLLRGKFTIGADAAAAAGPVGRQAAAATDSQLRAEILSYSRSRGLFAGVSLDGSALQIDNLANPSFYYPYGAGQGVVPESAVILVNTIAQLTATGVAPPAAAGVAPVPSLAPEPAPAPVPAAATAIHPPADQLRHQLADSAVRLNALLDENWKQFLALPAEIFSGTAAPPPAALEAVLANYDQVARNPNYGALAARPEFHATYDLLRQYAARELQDTAGTLQLPPPPTPAQSRVDTRQRY